ncbi:MAG: bifunctional hydroxymethylpyrimidine kinase/phosphomethylpyrimidine kinase, partial [Bdellovibrionales bacterium]|nr:bifunctional hydroxymethylpyrimidine kinase/phosphomethylpyrimidine kinase [Bdellovibrionales bacterium]
TPNLSEAMALAGVSQDDLRGVSDTLVELGAKLREIMGSQQVVITRGKDGMSLFEGASSEKIPTFARQVFDVTGAGDTVIATLAMAWTSGLSLKESCQLSNFAAGVVVGKIGCVPCTTQELREFINSFDGAKFPG